MCYWWLQWYVHTLYIIQPLVISVSVRAAVLFPWTVLWLISKKTVRTMLNASEKSHCWDFCVLYWCPDGRWDFSGLRIWNSSCIEICLFGSYNMQFSFISACCWRRAVRALMLGPQWLSLEREYKPGSDFLEGRADTNPISPSNVSYMESAGTYTWSSSMAQSMHELFSSTDYRWETAVNLCQKDPLAVNSR